MPRHSWLQRTESSLELLSQTHSLQHTTQKAQASRTHPSGPTQPAIHQKHLALLLTHLRHTAPVNLASDCSQSLMLMPSSLTCTRQHDDGGALCQVPG